MPLLIIAIALVFFAMQRGSVTSRGSVTEGNGDLPASNTALAVQAFTPQESFVNPQQVQKAVSNQITPAGVINTVQQAAQIGQTVKDLVSKAASVLTKATPAAVADVVPAAAAPVIETPAAAAGAAAAPASAPALGIVAQAVPVIGAMAAIYAGAQALGNAWVGPGPKTVEQNIQEDLALQKQIGAAAYAKLQPSTAAPDQSNNSLATPAKQLRASA